MDNLINQVKDLFEKLLVRSKKFEEQFDDVKNRRKKADDDSKANEQLTIELGKREKKVKSIEDIFKMKNEVTASYKELTSDKKLFKKEKDEYEVYKSNSEDEIKIGKEENTAARDKIKKLELELEDKKKKYKEGVMESINKTLKDKGISL